MTSIGGIPIIGLNEVRPDYGRWLIHGPQGAGKTTLASTIAEAGKTLFIDLVGEKGLRSIMGADYTGNIDVVRPTSIQQFDDLFWELDKGEHGYNAVVIDSLTAIQKMTNRFILGHDETAVREIRRGTAPASFQSWGQSLDVMVDTATFWYGLADGNRKKPMHVIMTAQTKITENEETGQIIRVPDVQRGALSLTLAAPDYVVYVETEENLEALGDENAPPSIFLARFGSHPGYRTKARIPVNLRGKLPSILGRKSPPNLVTLSRVLGIGGVPAKQAKATAKATETATTTKEN